MLRPKHLHLPVSTALLFAPLSPRLFQPETLARLLSSSSHPARFVFSPSLLLTFNLKLSTLNLFLPFPWY